MATDGSPARPTGTPLCIDGEVSLDRRGFIHARIDLERRLVHWQDSNQWNNNFVRALSKKQLQQIRDWIEDWPEATCYPAISGEPMNWLVSVETSDGKFVFDGRNSHDAVWMHWKKMLVQTKIR